MASKLPRFLATASKFALFSVSSLKDEKLIKQIYMKTETCKLCSSLWNISAKISSKLILTILSYTVSKLVHFWDTVYYFNTESHNGTFGCSSVLIPGIFNPV